MHGAHALNPGGPRGRWMEDPRWAMSRCAAPGPHGGGPHERPRHGFGGWGGGPPWGPGGGRGFGRRRRMRRGDVRAAALVLLAEQPYNGYGLIQEIEHRSDGLWRPSPGSVYPALSLLEDEGLVRSEQHEGRKQYALTDAGRAYVDEHRERLGEPWSGLADEEGGSGRHDLRGLIGQVAAATMQVAAAGDDRHVEQARKVLTDARRALYRILADEEEDAGE